MAIQHQNFVDLMDRLVSKGGRAVKIRRDVGAVPVDVTKPWLGEVPSLQDADAMAAFLDDDARDLLMALPGIPDERTTFERNINRNVLVPAKGLPFEVTTAHKVVDGTTVWEITNVVRIQPGATLVGYALRVAI